MWPSFGEQLHHALHPRLHLHVLVLCRHLGQLDAQARQHPRVLHLVQLVDAPAAVVRMATCGVEQMVAQDAEEQMTSEVHMKGLHGKPISLNF